MMTLDEQSATTCVARVAHEKNVRGLTYDSAKTLARLIVGYAAAAKVPAPLLMGVLAHESGFNVNAVNTRSDDWGIAQINGVHLRYWGVSPLEALEPEYGIRFAARKLAADVAWASNRFPDRDAHRVALLAYNRGRGGAIAVMSGGRVWLWLQEGYVRRVMRYHDRFQEAMYGSARN